MIQEILTLATEALHAMDEMENYIFTNHRAKYAYSKSIMDNYREEIAEIIKEINSNPDDSENAGALKKELMDMSTSVQNAQETGVIKPSINMETINNSINTMINDLDNNTPETVMPTANIDIQAIEQAIPTVEPTQVENIVAPNIAPEAQIPVQNVQQSVTPQPVELNATVTEVPQNIPEQMVTNNIANPIEVVEGTQDIVPEVPQIIIEEAPTIENVMPVSEQPQIVDSIGQEVIETVTPDIVIVADQPDQVVQTETINIQNVDPMIQVPNIEVAGQPPIIDTTQEVQA